MSVECSSVATESPETLPVVPAGDNTASKAAPAETSTSGRDQQATGHPHQAVPGDLAAAQREFERRARDLDRRAAELDARANLLALESEHLERLKADHARREAEIEQAEKEARDRLALAVAHEQAVTAAWGELDRWHARHRKKAADETCAPPPASDGAEPPFTNVAQPYPQQNPVSTPTPRTGNV